MSQNNIKTTINCGNRKIKINDITLNNNNCDKDKYKKKIKDECEDKHSCQITNQMFDCPGFEFGGINYACVDTESTDSSQGINISQSISVDLGDIIETEDNQSYPSYDASVTKLIQQSVAHRLQNINNFPVLGTETSEIKGSNNEMIQEIEPFNQLPTDFKVVNIYQQVTKKSWFFICILVLLIIIAMVIIMIFRKRS